MLIPNERIEEFAATLRAAGQRVVFTNGCFDILHAGHVRYLAAAGKGVLMTSHDLALSFTVSDRILVMNEGRMILSGTPEELLEERDPLRRCFGICLGKTNSGNALYAYELQN